MARRRPPAVDTDHALEEPPPNWLARQVFIHRWRQEYRPPLPKNRAQAYRTVYNAGPLEPRRARALGTGHDARQTPAASGGQKTTCAPANARHASATTRPPRIRPQDCPRGPYPAGLRRPESALLDARRPVTPNTQGDTHITLTDPTPAETIDAIGAANNVGRLAFDAPPAPRPSRGPAEEAPPARRPGRRRARRPIARPQHPPRNPRRPRGASPSRHAGPRHPRRDRAVGGTGAGRGRGSRAQDGRRRRPEGGPLPGGGAAPVSPSPPSPEAILRAAASAARGEPIDHRMRPYVRPGHNVTVTGFTPQ